MIACFFTISHSCLTHLIHNLTDEQAEKIISDTRDTSSDSSLVHHSASLGRFVPHHASAVFSAIEPGYF